MKNFSKPILVALTLTMTISAFAEETKLKRIGIDYISFGGSIGVHKNERSIEKTIDDVKLKSTGDSSNMAAEIEGAIRLTNKVNALIGVGAGLEGKIYKDTEGRSYITNPNGQVTTLLGVTYNITDNFTAGVGLKNYLSSPESTRLNAISGIVRYKIKNQNKDRGVIVNLEVEKQTDNSGYGIKVGASAAAF